MSADNRLMPLFESEGWPGPEAMNDGYQRKVSRADRNLQRNVLIANQIRTY
jgi:hypothetical protein